MSTNLEQFVESLVRSGLMSAQETEPIVDALSHDQRSDPQQLARALVELGKLTQFQATSILSGHVDGLVLGEYTVLDEIGKGGMGIVLKARHRRMRRTVAIKFLSADALHANAVERFYREVHTAAKLMHPNIVTALDAGEHNGTHYLVMEYVDGADVSKLVQRSGPLTLDTAIDITLQTARGLGYAHQQGIVHRDIKPANLLLATDGTVKILDMGLARFSTDLGDAIDETERLQLTRTGNVMGTVDYMAPEQAEDARSADHRADIYSLGCTMYRMLTGRSPYSAETLMKTLLAHRDAPIPSMHQYRADIPLELDAVFAKMVGKRPEDRHQSMDEVIAAIESIAIPIAATPIESKGSESLAVAETIVVNQHDIESEVQSAAPTIKLSTTDPSVRRKQLSIAAISVGTLALIALLWSMLPESNDTNSVTPTDSSGNGLASIVAPNDEGDNKPNADQRDNGGTADSTEPAATAPDRFAISFNADGSVYPSTIPWSKTQEFCLEAYVTPTRLNEDQTVIEFRPGIWLGILEGEWLAYVSCGGVNAQVFGNGKVTPGKPVHVALVRDQQDLKLFVDGNLNDTHALPAAEIKTSKKARVQIGRGLTGSIDEVRISSDPRYKANFTPAKRFEADEKTVLLYHFDDNSDNEKAIDATGKHEGWIDQGKFVNKIAD